MKPPKPPIIPTLEKAHEDLDPLIGKLFAAFKPASAEAKDYSKTKDDSDESFFSHHVRYLAKIILRSEGIETEDECELEQTSNTGICITQTPHYLIRVLRDTHGGGLPAAGDSERRKRFFAQQCEQLRLPFGQGAEKDNKDDQHEPAHIVFLWSSDQERHFTGLWFICPNGEKAAPHFQEWLPLPESGELGLTQAEPPQGELPPSDLGMTWKDGSKEQIKPKTGTGSSE